MKRKVECAIRHGKLVNRIANALDTSCYLFDGYYYIVAGENKRLVTVFRPQKLKTKSKKMLLDDLKIKEFYKELRFASASI